MDTVVAAEDLALTLQSLGSLQDAQELLERCLDIRKTIIAEDHIQVILFIFGKVNFLIKIKTLYWLFLENYSISFLDSYIAHGYNSVYTSDYGK